MFGMPPSIVWVGKLSAFWLSDKYAMPGLNQETPFFAFSAGVDHRQGSMTAGFANTRDQDPALVLRLHCYVCEGLLVSLQDHVNLMLPHPTQAKSCLPIQT